MNLESLEKEWLELGTKYRNDDLLLSGIWKKIIQKYSQKNRHYHNLKHIESMLQLVEENKKDIIDVDSLLFSIWFHDIIYKASSKKNEEKSAVFCQKILKKLTVPFSKIDKITALIISTKAHKIELKENKDNAFLLDFDLVILGKPWVTYQSYTQKIRKEYNMYPDFLYKPGRKKVLKSFLERENLYFTKKYQTLLEAQARKNIAKEISKLR